MTSNVTFWDIISIFPKGEEPVSLTSKEVCAQIKAARDAVLERVIERLLTPQCSIFSDFLNENNVLVPIPGSAKTSQGALWTPYVIAERLVEAGLGGIIMPCLVRTTGVRKSHWQSSRNRVSIKEHENTISFQVPAIEAPESITLIDDVLTLGWTSYACFNILKKAFPESTIRMFAVLRTRSLIPEIEQILEPTVGTLVANENGYVTHDPI